MFLADASPFLDRDTTYGTCLLVLLLGVAFAYYITRDKNDEPT